MAKKILVVDDDPVVTRLVSSVLVTQGFNVSCVDNGLDALVKLKKEKFELVVLDVMMPEINGYDVCYQLRFNQEYEQIPIVIVTSREQELEDKIGKREDIEYLQKPIDSKLLLEKIDLLLKKKK